MSRNGREKAIKAIKSDLRILKWSIVINFAHVIYKLILGLMIFKRNVENLIFHIMLIAMFATPYATLYIADGEDYWAGILAIISFFALLLLHLLDRNKQIIITTTDVALVLCSIS